MRISNPNIQPAIVAQNTNRNIKQNQNKSVDRVDIPQENQHGQKNKALNRATNPTDKTLIYDYGFAGNSSRARVSPGAMVQSSSEKITHELNTNQQQTSNNHKIIRGSLVTENQNSIVATAINAYTGNQDLVQTEQFTQLMGVDVFA